MARVLPVFIASPGDVQEERELVKRAIEELSPRLARLFGVALVPVDWRQFAPDVGPDSKLVFQDRILQSIEPDSLFVGILYRRIGTPVAKSTNITGTEAEYNYALANRERLKILTYFRKITDITEDQLKIAEFRKRIQDSGLAIQEYDKVEAFAERITLDLLESVVSALSGDAVRRRRLYSEFFRLGSHRRHPESSPTLIVYPPIHKHDSSSLELRRSNYNWRARLLPNVVFEDFKAIQKLESALRTMGVSDYASVTTLYPGAVLDPGNRIWICIPRSRPALHQLANLGSRVDFAFEAIGQPGAPDYSQQIRWCPQGEKPIVVRSPLAKYLAVQRPTGKRKWEARFGDIYARDFAIIARFCLDGSGAPRHSFYNYFLAGIRGLGTWGAGCFVDRHPEELAKLSRTAGTDDIQVLLEVTYQNYRIIKVEDVTHKTQDYFDRQFSDEFIGSMIEQ